jgi:DNA-binding MarR family transcriptional regulator
MMMEEDPLLGAAISLRRGVTRLGQRLRAERPADSQPLARLGVLAQLHLRGAASAGALAVSAGVQPQTLTRTLAGLEHDGLVTRQADPADRRRALLALTSAGREVLTADMQQRDGWLAAAMASELTPTEHEILRLAGDLMDRLAGTARL